VFYVDEHWTRAFRFTKLHKPFSLAVCVGSPGLLGVEASPTQRLSVALWSIGVDFGVEEQGASLTRNILTLHSHLSASKNAPPKVNKSGRSTKYIFILLSNYSRLLYIESRHVLILAPRLHCMESTRQSCPGIHPSFRILSIPSIKIPPLEKGVLLRTPQRSSNVINRRKEMNGLRRCAFRRRA
jgi:hypothetical protein